MQDGVRSGGLRTVWSWSGHVLALVVYVGLMVVVFRPVLGHIDERVVGAWDGDTSFTLYGLWHFERNGGRYWLDGDRPLLGYPLGAHHEAWPQVYEGIDLKCLYACYRRVLGVLGAYNATLLTVLLLNALAAYGFVWRYAGSRWAAFLAAILVNANFGTMHRVAGHIHLFKHYWTVLVAAALLEWLRHPTYWRAVLGGMVLALAVASSFYFGYFLCLFVAAVFVWGLLKGWWQRAHWVRLPAAALSFVVLAGLLVFPVFTRSMASDWSRDYFHRGPGEVLYYASQLVQYVVPPYSRFARKIESFVVTEGCNYAGLVNLLVFAVAFVAWVVRRIQAPRTEAAASVAGAGCAPKSALAGRRGVEALLLFGLGVMILVSLRGNVNLLLNLVFKQFRVYGRAGLLAVTFWSLFSACVVGAACRTWRRRWLGPPVVLGLMLLAVWDGAQMSTGSSRTLYGRFFWTRPEVPAWVGWLRDQAPQCSAIVYPVQPLEEDRYRAMYYQIHHGHPVFYGAVPGSDGYLLGKRLARLDELSVELIRTLGIDYVIVTSAYEPFRRGHKLPVPSRLAGLRRVARIQGATVYEPVGGAAPSTTGPVFQIDEALAALDPPETVPAGRRVWVPLRPRRQFLLGCDVYYRCRWRRADGYEVKLSVPEPVRADRYEPSRASRLLLRTPPRPGRYTCLIESDRRRRGKRMLLFRLELTVRR